MKKWISVKDRLPENGKIVIVFMPAYGKEAYQSWKINMVMYWNNEYTKGFMVQAYCRPSEDVTHWMPLPEPPK